MRFAAIGRAAPGYPREALEHLIAQGRGLGLDVELEAEQFAVLADPGAPKVAFSGGGGVVLGRLWARSDGAGRQSCLDQATVAAVRTSRSATLLSEFWGAYVAFVVSPDGATLQVLRDPSGAAPCYRISAYGLTVVVSDLETARGLGILQAHIDWGYISQHIAFGGLRVARTGLKNLVEILPGTGVTLGTLDQAASLIWKPGDFTCDEQQIFDPREAAALVAAETRRCVVRQAEAFGVIALELSGGLDSSIISACLAGRPDTYAVNCATYRPEGDERRYARAAARAAAIPLTEITLDRHAIDFLKPPTLWLARPGRAAALESIDKAFLAFGQTHQAGAFFSGGGGDNVYCYLKSAAPVVDRLRTEGVGWGLIRTALDISRLHGATVWSVAAQAVKFALRPDGATRAKPRIALLDPDTLPERPEPHPWLEGQGVRLPGRYRHVHSIAWILGLLDGHERSRYAPMIFPLLAQPLLEACLRIPTWLWVEGGVDRSVAREAFAGRSPPEILARRTKGRIDRDIAAAYDAQRRVLADHLLGGLLATHRVINVVAVEKALKAPWDARQGSFSTLLALADAETWARQWKGAGS